MVRADALAPTSPRRLVWAILLLAFPLAFFGALQPANEYQATLGLDALDCDGPFQVLLFAAPALLIYGIGALLSLVRWRRLSNLVVGLVCLAISAAVMANGARALAQEQEQHEACAAR